MVGTVRIIWNEDGGTLRDPSGKVLAGPNDSLTVDSATAERYVRDGRAHYPPRK